MHIMTTKAIWNHCELWVKAYNRKKCTKYETCDIDNPYNTESYNMIQFIIMGFQSEEKTGWIIPNNTTRQPPS